MITFRHTVSLIAMSTLLIGSACKEEQKPDVDTAAVTETILDNAGDAVKVVEGWSVDRTSKADLQQYFKSQSRKSGNSDAALAKLGMAESGGAASWDSMSESGGTYTYKNLTFGAGSEKMKAAEMQLSGVHMVGGNASFDNMVLMNAKVENADGSASFDTLSVADPSPKMAGTILSGLSQLSSMDDISANVELDDGELPFGAFMMEGVKMSGDGNTASIETLGYGVNDTDGTGSFLVSNLSLDGMDDETGRAMKLRLGSASGSAIDLKILQAMQGDMEMLSEQANPMSGGTGSVVIEDFNLSADVMNMSMEMIQVETTKSGDVATQKMELRPLTLSFSEAPDVPELMQAYQVLQSLGYDELVLSGNMTARMEESTKTVILEDTSFSLKDGFDIGMAMKMSDFSEDDDSDPLLHNMTLNFTDNSIVERAFEMAAEMQGGNAALMRQQVKAGLSMASMMVETPEQRKMVSAMTGPLAEFLDDGGTLTLNMNPAQPIRASAIEDMGEDPAVMEILGLSLTHNQ